MLRFSGGAKENNRLGAGLSGAECEGSSRTVLFGYSRRLLQTGMAKEGSNLVEFQAQEKVVLRRGCEVRGVPRSRADPRRLRPRSGRAKPVREVVAGRSTLMSRSSGGDLTERLRGQPSRPADSAACGGLWLGRGRVRVTVPGERATASAGGRA